MPGRTLGGAGQGWQRGCRVWAAEEDCGEPFLGDGTLLI